MSMFPVLAVGWMSLAPLSALIVLLASVSVATILVGRGWRGTASPAEPRCAKCRYDLRGYAGTPPARCAECGADLAAPRAIAWGRSRRNLKLVVGGLVLPFVVFAVSFLALQVYASRQDRYSPLRSTAAVLASLPNTTGLPYDWQDLQTRLGKKRLSQSEARQAVDILIARLQAGPSQTVISWSDQFLLSVETAGFLSNQQYLQLSKLLFRSPTVALPKVARRGGALQFTLHNPGSGTFALLDYAKALRQVKLADGKELIIKPYALDSGAPTTNPDLFGALGASQDIRGTLSADLPPGDYQLTFVIDEAALVNQTAPRLEGGRPLGLRGPAGLRANLGGGCCDQGCADSPVRS